MTKVQLRTATGFAPAPILSPSQFTSSRPEFWTRGRGGPTIVVLSNVAGTGAILTERALRVLLATAAEPVYALSTRPLANPVSGKVPLPPSQVLARVRSALSLTITELASILRVERPTIYAWLAQRAEPRPQNRRRLGRLLSIADVWANLSSEPLGDAVRWQDASGSTLVDILRRDDFDGAVARLTALASAASERQMTARESRLERLRVFAATHKLPQESSEGQEALDIETGKRISPE